MIDLRGLDFRAAARGSGTNLLFCSDWQICTSSSWPARINNRKVSRTPHSFGPFVGITHSYTFKKPASDDLEAA